MAVNYHPHEVSFVLIDYKGGGLTDAFYNPNTGMRLPHLAGTITNLDGASIQRSLMSIESELVRRQKEFSRVSKELNEGSMNIYTYQKLYRAGKVSKPMPHLFIVSDEFAELKQQQPEFMEKLISAARIGRSLGIHLILATQKPAGTVDDKIWSNTRFRLCLRVADKQDSMDMLHRPEAVNLVNAGRCFLQVGNNEVFEKLQTGYGKAAYGEEESKEAAVLVTATGKRLYGKKEKTKKSLSQLEAVTDYVNQCADRLGFSKAGKLWMEELPERLVLGDMDIEKKDREKRDVEIVRKGKPEEKSDVLRMSEEKSEMQERENDKKIRFCLGKYDDPGRQRQAALFYEPLEEGHLCLCGMPSTGKSTFLQTLLWQISKNYTPRELLFVMAAADSAGISCFEKMPHCIGSIKNVRDGESFFYHLKKFLEDRKKLLKGVNFLQYRKKQKKPIPPLLILIDNYGTFRQMTEDGYEEFLERLAREGLQYGIYLIITALGTGSGELPGRMFEKLKTVLTLEMSDKVQYGDAFRQYQIPVCPTPNIKGRGLCKSSSGGGCRSDYIRSRTSDDAS